MKAGKDDNREQGGDRKDEKQLHDLNRTVQYYALLMGVIGCVNLWLYWSEGLRFSLWLGVACFACLGAWILYSRRVIR